MPTDTGMTYPFPYKTENGLFGEPPDPFVVDNLVVKNDASIAHDLTVGGTITGPNINVDNVTAKQYTATNATNQFNTTQSDMEFKTQDMVPEFNFKNSTDQTYFSTINAGEYKGTLTTNTSSLNGSLLTSQTNTHSGVNNEAGFSSRTNTDQLDMVMKADTRRGQIRTSTDAFGLDLSVQGASKSIKLVTNASDRLTVTDVGVDIPVLGSNAPGSIVATTLHTINTNDIVLETNDAPNLFDGGMIVAKTLIAGHIEKTPIGGAIASTGRFTTINTTDTSDIVLDYSTDPETKIVTINTLTAPNNTVGGLITQRQFAKQITFYNDDLPSIDEPIINAIKVLTGNTSLTSVTSDLLTSTRVVATNFSCLSLSDYTATPPSILTGGGILVGKGVSMDRLLVRDTNDYDGSPAAIVCLGGANISKTLQADSLIGASTSIASTTSAPIISNGGLLVKKNAKIDTIQVSSLNNATSKTTGAVQIVGGLSCQKDIWSDNMFAANATFTGDLKGKTLLIDQHAAVETLDVTKNTDSTSTTTGAVTVVGGIGVQMGIYCNTLHVVEDAHVDTLEVLNANNSSGTTTGAVTIAGGLGVAKDIWAANVFVTDDMTITKKLKTDELEVMNVEDSSSTTTGAVIIHGGLGVGKSLYTQTLHVVEDAHVDTLEVLNANNSSGTTTGAVTIAGGLGVGKDLYANNLTATTAVKGNTVEATTSVKGESVEATTSVKGATVEATTSVKGATVEATTSVKGATLIATASITCSSNVINTTGATLGTLNAGVTTLGNTTCGTLTCGDVTAGNVTCAVMESASVTTGDVNCAIMTSASVVTGNVNCAIMTSTAVATGAIGAADVTCITANVVGIGIAGATLTVGLPLVSLLPSIVCGGTGASIKAVGPASIMGADKGLFREIRCEDLDPIALDPPPIITCTGNIEGQNLRSYGNTDVDETLRIFGDGVSGYSLVVDHNAVVHGAFQAEGNVTLTGTGTALDVTNDVHVHGNLTVDGVTTTGATSLHLTGLGTALTVDHDALISGALTVGDTTLLDVGLTVTNSSVISGNLNVSMGITSASISSDTITTTGTVGLGLDVNRGARVAGTLITSDISGTTITLSGATGTALTVSGDVVLNNALNVTGISTLGAVNSGAHSATTLAATATGTALTVTYNASIGGVLQVTGLSNLGPVSAGALSASTLTGTLLTVNSNATVGGTLGVTGITTLGIVNSGAHSATTLTASATGTALTVTYNASIGGTLNVTGATSLTTVSAVSVNASGLTANGAGTALTVTNNATIGGTLGVTGITTLGVVNSGAHSATTLSATAAGTALTVTNNATIGGTFGVTGITTLGVVNSGAHSATTLAATAAGTALTVTNNATIGGTLGVTGTTTLVGVNSGALSATTLAATAAGTALTVTNNATIGGTFGVTGITTLGVVNSGAHSATTLSATAAGTALTVTNNATIGGTLGVTGTTTLGVVTTGAITGTTVTGTAGVVSGGFDFKLGNTDQTTRGNSGLSRALVKEASNTLYINYANDFTGGTLVNSNLNVTGTLRVTGTTTLGAVNSGAISATTLTATAAGTALTVTNNATVGGTLGVTGTTTLGVVNSGALSATTLSASAAGTALTVTNNATISGTLTVGTLSPTTINTTGNVTIGGTLVTTGATTASVFNALAGTAGGTGNVHYALRTTGNVIRVGLGLGNSEAGSNSGSDFKIYTYSDTGTIIAEAVKLVRATGTLAITNNATVGGTLEVGTSGNAGYFKCAASSADYTLIGVEQTYTPSNSNSRIFLFGSTATSTPNTIIYNATTQQFYGSGSIAGSVLQAGSLSLASTGTGLSVTTNASIGGTLTIAGAGTGLAVTNNVSIGGSLSIATLVINNTGPSAFYCAGTGLFDKDLYTTGGVHNGGFDFNVGAGDQTTRGNSGTSRAFVKDAGATLVVNYAADFGGGLRVDSVLSVLTSIKSASVTIGLTGGGSNFLSFRGPSSEIGQVFANGGGGVTYGISSDYRLKKNIKSLVGGLALVNAVESKTFQYKENGTIPLFGFLAHEVQKACPSAVYGQKDDVNSDGELVYQKLDMMQLVPVLWAAVQELSSTLKKMQTDIDSLLKIIP